MMWFVEKTDEAFGIYNFFGIPTKTEIMTKMFFSSEESAMNYVKKQINKK